MRSCRVGNVDGVSSELSRSRRAKVGFSDGGGAREGSVSSTSNRVELRRLLPFVQLHLPPSTADRVFKNLLAWIDCSTSHSILGPLPSKLSLSSLKRSHFLPSSSPSFPPPSLRSPSRLHLPSLNPFLLITRPLLSSPRHLTSSIPTSST